MAFVGRDLELARLSAALQRAADGSASRVVLRGPTGIGISALLDELEHRLGDVPGVVVARGGAFEPTSGAPFFALAGALSRAFTACADQDLARVVGGAGHDLALLLPELEPRLASLAVAMDEPRLVAPEQRGARVIEAIIGALDRLGSGGVVLLVLEDLQWADPATRAFIETLLRITRRLALCLVATYDPEEFHRRHPGRELVQALESSAQVDLLTLGPLDRDELASFAEGVLGDRPPGSLLAALLEGSRGNPLLATQLLAAHADVEGLRLSDSFEAVLQARLAALRRPAMRAVQVLAAARRPVPRQPLLRLALPEGYLAAAGLTEAIESGLAVGSGDHAGTDRVGVPHPLAAEAIERLMSPAERQAVHGVLAASLAGTPSERAWHREAAMDFAAAREAHVAAGRAAEALDPGATALLHYERALELSGDPSVDGRDPVEAAELLERAAAAASSAGAFRRAASLVQQAITVRSEPTRAATGAGRDQGGSADLERTLGELHERLGRYRWAAGDQTSALEAFEKALELIPGEPSKVRARALASQAQHLMIAGRFDDSARVAEEAREVAGTVGGEALAELGHATCTLGVDLGYDGQLGRGLHLLEEATALAREAGRLDDLMRAFANRTTLLDLDSRRNDALEVVKEGLAEARRAGQEGVYGAFLRGNAADILFMLGRWSESEAECRAALEWTPAGVAWFTPTLYLSLLLTESRADDEASRMVGQTLLQLETVPAGQWTALVQRSAVSLALWRGDLADAQQVAGREWDRVLQTDDAAQVAMAASTILEACAAAADDARAHRDYAAVASAGELAVSVLRAAEERVAASDLPPSLGSRREAQLHLDTARAHDARRRGRADPRAFGRIADAWTARAVPYFAAKARWWEALAALQAGEQRLRARDALGEAWRLAAALPARPLLRELSDLARRARIPLPVVDGLEPDALLATNLASDGPDATAPVLATSKPGGRPGRRRLAPETERTGLAEPADTSQLPTPLRGRVPVGPGINRARVSEVHGGELEATRLEDLDVDEIIASASTSTGRAIGERLVAREEWEQRDPFGLSPRETEVLSVLVEGRTNREIAARLYISERTVGVHVRKILAKLGVAGRVEAASLAIRQGLVPEEPSDFVRRT